MTPERWKQIDELAQAAIERGGDERVAFLDQACSGDESLRREVESQIAYQQQASKFLEEPAFKDAADLIAEPQTETDSIEGRTISHYSILRKLGAGGMGDVYLAQDTTLSRKVAIKFLSQNSVAGEQAKKRLVREAKAAAALDHPHICAVHEVGEESGHSFIVMQYVEGETLASRIQRQPLELREALDIAVQIADALAEAHSHRIIHRDVKPLNVMLTASGQVKVLDFGLARVVREGSLDSTEQTESLLTMPGSVIGTVPNMSPEQVKGQKVDARSDVFSLGTVLYEMISGRQPFAAGSTAETISAILGEEPPPLARYATNVPQELQRIVCKCLEKDKERRYQSTRDLLVDLRKLKNDTDSGVAAVSSSVPNHRARHKWTYLAVALAILALGAIALYFLRGESQSTNNAIHSLAILPFVNTSGDPNAEYLSDGITESLINSFSQLPQLKVIARTTAFRYKGKDTDPQLIGRDLRVDAIVTGRVTQLGDTLIVQADLLSTTDGSQVWGERYSRRLSDIFALEEQVAKEIAEKLRLRLTGEERQGLSKRYTENITAYQNYSLAWTYLQRRTRQDFFTAISYFEKAIDEEPNYALAYAALTEAYVSLTIRGLIESVEGRRKAEEAARKAVSLDENLAEAHVAIGEIHVFFTPFDFSTGDQELRRAIELSPSAARAYQVLGASLMEQGRLDESLGVWLRARELDPLSPTVARMEASAYLFKRDYPRSLELLRRSYELGPSFIIWTEIESYIQNGKLDEALLELEKAKRERKDDPIFPYSMGMVYAAQGKRAEALQTIKELAQMSVSTISRAQQLAGIYAALNEKELALGWLERGLEAGVIPIFFKDAPVWDTIRGEQRFRDLMKRMGIPQ